MRMQILNLTKVIAFGKKTASAATLAALLLFVGTPRATADDDGCRRRVAHADHKLHEAIEHHGYTSRQASHWRNKLHEARERCWRERKQWWEVHENRWHHDHDWDDHDHDHH